MIDTDKYKGHTPAPWRYSNGTIWGGEGDNYISLALDLEGSYQPRDVVLMADAPLLLAEVKRLRHELEIKKEALAKSQSSYKELRKLKNV